MTELGAVSLDNSSIFGLKLLLEMAKLSLKNEF